MADLQQYGGPVLEESVSQTTLVPSVPLGARRQHKGEEYVYCYNASGGAISATVGVKFITGASGYSIANTCATDAFNPFVGVVKHSALATSEYGWVMTRGFSNVKVVSASTADYKMIALGEDGYFIEASGTTTLGTATVVGYLLSHNTAASGLAYAFIKGGA
jgi:hypothetical protein